MINQITLDPRNLSPRNNRAETKLPWFTAITQNGDSYYPNLSDWLPGDIILFSKNVDGTQPNIESELIELIQTTLHQPAHDAQWIHAAIYLGNGACIEAVNDPQVQQKGIIVNLDSLPSRVAHQMIRVRRPDKNKAGQPWSRTDGERVMMAALHYTSTYYPDWIKSSAALASNLFPNPTATWRSILQMSNIVGASFATMLCVRAYAHVLGMDITIKAQKLPFALSQSAMLKDVDIFWREVAP